MKVIEDYVKEDYLSEMFFWKYLNINKLIPPFDASEDWRSATLEGQIDSNGSDLQDQPSMPILKTQATDNSDVKQKSLMTDNIIVHNQISVSIINREPVLKKCKHFNSWYYLIKERNVMIWTLIFLANEKDEDCVTEICTLFKEIKQEHKNNKKKYTGFKWITMLRDRVVIVRFSHFYLKITVCLN